MARQFDCKAYRSCLDQAARLDAPLNCPCSRYERDPQAAAWTDVQGCRHLVLAILRPDCFEVFQALRAIRGNREKWRFLRESWPLLGLRRRDS